MNHPIFIGYQELPKSMGGGSMALFNLTEPLENHPAGSTVSERTLRDNGWTAEMIAGLIVFSRSDRIEWRRVTDPMNPAPAEYFRSNGSPKCPTSCEVGSQSGELPD